MKYDIGFIGAGNMASAIVNGIINANIFPANQILISDIDEEKLYAFKNKGINTTSDNEFLLKNCDYVLFAVKPQVAKELLPKLKNAVNGNNFISIMAGLSIKTIKGFLGDIKIARIMPNTPCLVGAGMCAIDTGNFDENNVSVLSKIFYSLGEVVFLKEDKFNAVTAVSGSGPAYVYKFIKAVIDGGVECGLDYETSKKLTLQTFGGAKKMVEISDLPIEKLIENVCSKGGTTIQAVEYYNQANLETIIKCGMEKCRTRSEELSNETR